MSIPKMFRSRRSSSEQNDDEQILPSSTSNIKLHSSELDEKSPSPANANKKDNPGHVTSILNYNAEGSDIHPADISDKETDYTSGDEAESYVTMSSDEEEDDEDDSGGQATLSDSESYDENDENNNLVNAGAWDDYEIDPNTILEIPQEPLGVENLVPREQLEELGHIERRISIEGQKFKVVSNLEVNNSLFRAVSRAVSGTESNYKKIRKAILLEILQNWSTYLSDISDDCGYNMLHLPSLIKPQILLSKYKTKFQNAKGSPLFQLNAASKAYGFNYVVIDAGHYEGTARLTSHYDKLLKVLGVDSVYHFLRIGTLPESWYYEFIVPIGPPKLPPDGNYEIVMYDVVQVDKILGHKINQTKTRTIRKIDVESGIPQLTNQPKLCFGLDHRMYFYLPTYTHDLWSLISELLFKKISYAPHIYRAALQMRYEASSYYHYSKLKKRIIYRGTGEDKKLREKFRKSLQRGYKNKGNTHDLEHIAESLKFSFTVIGTDVNGNFFWKQSLVSASTNTDMSDSPEHLALFVHLQKNQETQWYALKCSGWDCPLEKLIYREKTFTDDTTEKRRLYYSKTAPRGSSWSVRTSKSGWGQLLSTFKQSRRRLSKGVSQFLETSRIASVAQFLTSLSIGFFHRISGWLRIFRRNSKVLPEENVKELFIRDLP